MSGNVELFAVCNMKSEDIDKENNDEQQEEAWPEIENLLSNYKDVFSEDKANKLLPYSQLEHAIELTNEPLYRLIYSLLEKELKVLYKYI